MMLSNLDMESVFILIGTAVAAFLGYLGSKATAKSQEKTQLISSYSPDWQAFTEDIREHYDKVIHDMKTQNEENLELIDSRHNQELEQVNKRIKNLERVVENMKKDLTTLEEKYSDSINYIKRVRLQVPEVTKMDLPKSIASDI